LEVRIQRSPNPFLESNRTLRQLDAYQHLFTLLLVGLIGFAHWPSGRLWALLKRDDLPENNLVHPGFSTNEEGRSDDFPVRDHGPAPVFKGGDYYDHLWIRHSNLQVPDSLGADLHLFESLPPESVNAFKRACYWYALGIQFRSFPSLLWPFPLPLSAYCLPPPPSVARNVASHLALDPRSYLTFT
jgi:hypothetical protein